MAKEKEYHASNAEDVLLEVIRLRDRGEAQASIRMCERAITEYPHLQDWLLDNKARALVDLRQRESACNIWDSLRSSKNRSVAKIAAENLAIQKKHIKADAAITRAKQLLSAGQTEDIAETLLPLSDDNDEYTRNAINAFCELYLPDKLLARLRREQNKALAGRFQKRIARKRSHLDRISAMAVCLDIEYCKSAMDRSIRENKRIDTRLEMAEHIIANAEDFEQLKISSSFDLRAYAHEYNCEPLDAPFDLLSDASYTKRPFPEFDTEFVRELYADKIASELILHPYLLYIRSPSIHISPSQYIAEGSQKRAEGTDESNEYWNFERVNEHLHGLYSLKEEVEIEYFRTSRIIHILVPSFDARSISAGFFGVFAVAKILAELTNSSKSAPKVNLLFVDRFDFYPSLFSYVLSKTTGLEDLLDLVSYSFLRASMSEKHSHALISIGPNDLFVATVWYTASIAKSISRLQGSGTKYLYLIQDYEAGFHPRGSHFCLAQQTYKKDDYHALVSSRPLFVQLKKQGAIPEESIFFENASASKRIPKSLFMDTQNKKTHKNLVLYARPDVDRNMFEIALLALMKAYRMGAFPGNWHFYSIGLGSTRIELSDDPHGNHTFVKQCARMTLVEYEDFIQSADLCLTLMASPHPSLLPFDFSGNGTVVVTNTFETKDKAYFSDYSPLIIATEPDPDQLAKSLMIAAEKCNDLNWRYENRCEAYPRSWEKTWTKEIKRFMQRWLSQ